MSAGNRARPARRTPPAPGTAAARSGAAGAAGALVHERDELLLPQRQRRGQHEHAPVVRHGGLERRLDADDGDVRKGGAQRANGRARGRVAGDDGGLDAAVIQPADDILRQAADLRDRAHAVGGVGRVAEIEKVLPGRRCTSARRTLMPPRPESNTAIGSSVRSMVRPPSRISYRMYLLYHIRRSFQVRRWRAAGTSVHSWCVSRMESVWLQAIMDAATAVQSRLPKG